MRVALILFSLVVMATAQLDPRVEPLTKLSEAEIRSIMQNAPRVNAIIDCVMKRGPCDKDPIANPLQIMVSDWAATKVICNGCPRGSRQKASLMISLLQTDYLPQYNEIAKAYGLL